jgi:hypothetical protein
MNVYSDGKWGSYRHLPLGTCTSIAVPHAHINIGTRGDLSSFRWIEGNLDPQRYGRDVSSSTVPLLKSHFTIIQGLQKSDWGTLVPKINVENSIKLGFLLE